MKMNKVSFDYFFPKDFFKKEINERFQLYLLKNCFDLFCEKKIIWGNANQKEPDLIIDNMPFELTLASTEKETTTYIKDIKDHKLKTNNIEELSIQCINNACKKKSNKNYSTVNNTISVLLTIPVFVWCMRYYSNIPDLLPPTNFSELLKSIKNTYIDNEKFKDVLLHMPGFAYDWFSFSCKECDLVRHHSLTVEEIRNNKVPYVIKNGPITTEEVKL